MHKRPGSPPGRSPFTQHTPPSLPRDQLPPQRRELPPHRAVVDSVAHPHYHAAQDPSRSEEHTSELQSRLHLVCRLLLEKKNHTARSPPAARGDRSGPDG